MASCISMFMFVMISFWKCRLGFTLHILEGNKDCEFVVVLE